jgi:hypothetical protein
MSKLFLIRHTNLSIMIVTASLLSGCGSDSNENKTFSGYMPKFSVDNVKAAPTSSILSALVDDSQEKTKKHLSSPVKTETRNTLASAAASSHADDSSTASIEFESTDCSKATDLWNSSPQANDFSNNALDFTRNLQAQTVFYDCITREQVFNRSAQISTVDSISTVTAESEERSNSYFVSWSMPTEVLNASQNKELQIDSQGILVNLQPGIDSSKTRVDLRQALVNDEFSKRIRSTLQDRLGETTNIRSVTVTERRSNSDVLLQQNIAGRVIFDNKLSVLTAAIKPNVGAVMYLKQCETSQAGEADDYLRECQSAWEEVVYGPLWDITTDVNVSTEIKNNLNITLGSNAAGAVSIEAEQKFYNDEDESTFFNQRALPAALIIK